jgi:hypothetical protein
MSGTQIRFTHVTQGFARLLSSPATASAIVGVLAAVIAAGTWRLAAGATVTIAAYAVLRRLPTRQEANLRQAALADGPLLCAVAAAVVAVGGDEADVARLCARTAHAALAEFFNQAAARIRAGSPPDIEWQRIATHAPELALLCSAMSHSA